MNFIFLNSIYLKINPISFGILQKQASIYDMSINQLQTQLSKDVLIKAFG